MFSRPRNKKVICKRCNKEFLAKKSNAFYCNECSSIVRREKMRQRHQMEKNWKAGNIKINPYFLTRGDIWKISGNGYSAWDNV